jgi:hypothetical protein
MKCPQLANDKLVFDGVFENKFSIELPTQCSSNSRNAEQTPDPHFTLSLSNFTKLSKKTAAILRYGFCVNIGMTRSVANIHEGARFVVL